MIIPPIRSKHKSGGLHVWRYDTPEREANDGLADAGASVHSLGSASRNDTRRLDVPNFHQRCYLLYYPECLNELLQRGPKRQGRDLMAVRRINVHCKKYGSINR